MAIILEQLLQILVHLHVGWGLQEKTLPERISLRYVRQEFGVGPFVYISVYARQLRNATSRALIPNFPRLNIRQELRLRFQHMRV